MPRSSDPPVWHAWPLTVAQAVAVQHQWRPRVVVHGGVKAMTRVAGADVAMVPGGTACRGVIAVLALPGFQLLDLAEVIRPVTFPYVPGFLSFREAPVLLACWAQLRVRPDVVLVDGQGIAHPRRFGIASHLGVWWDWPTIGVAKSRLCGAHPPVPDRLGATVPLQDGGEQIGVVLRSRVGVRPIYISPGHRMGMAEALQVVRRCLAGYRLPEPTRVADRYSKRPAIC